MDIKTRWDSRALGEGRGFRSPLAAALTAAVVVLAGGVGLVAGASGAKS